MKSLDLKRIMIFGRPGSGKSTFATWLSKFLELPVYYLDKYFFVENWIERDYNEFMQIQQNIVNSERWIIDGNSIRSLEVRFAKADLILYFNFSKIFCTYRIFKRFFQSNKLLNYRAYGCKEKIDLSFLLYTWKFDGRVAKNIEVLRKRYPYKIFKEIMDDNDLNKLKNELVKIHK